MGIIRKESTDGFVPVHEFLRELVFLGMLEQVFYELGEHGLEFLERGRLRHVRDSGDESLMMRVDNSLRGTQVRKRIASTVRPMRKKRGSLKGGEGGVL